MVALRVADTFVISVFGDNGYWGRRLGGIRVVEVAAHELVLHPAQCVDLMIWFATEIAGYESYGCYDMGTARSPEGDPRTLFIPQLRSSPTDSTAPCSTSPGASRALSSTWNWTPSCRRSASS